MGDVTEIAEDPVVSSLGRKDLHQVEKVPASIVGSLRKESAGPWV